MPGDPGRGENTTLRHAAGETSKLNRKRPGIPLLVVGRGTAVRWAGRRQTGRGKRNAACRRKGASLASITNRLLVSVRPGNRKLDLTPRSRLDLTPRSRFLPRR
jgi:hypothetical protein